MAVILLLVTAPHSRLKSCNKVSVLEHLHGVTGYLYCPKTSLKCFWDGPSPKTKQSLHSQLQIWRRSIECADLGYACDAIAWCHTPSEVTKMCFGEVCLLHQLNLTPSKHLSVSSDTQNGQQYYLNISSKSKFHLMIWYIIQLKLRPLSTLYLDVENVQKPSRKHVDESNKMSHYELQNDKNHCAKKPLSTRWPPC